MESIKEIVCLNCKRLLGKGVNLAEISRLMQIHPSTISRWKSGEHAPELDKLDKLAEILKISPTEFFKRELDSSPALSITKLAKRIVAIPDNIYEMALKIGKDDKEAWEDVETVLESAIERREAKKPRKI